MSRTLAVAVVPGDGIGKEVVPAALSVLGAFGLDIEKIPLEIGYGKWERTGSALTDDDMDIIKECDCVLFGAITTPPDPNYRSVLVRLRKELDLYANIRPFSPLKTVKLPCAKKFDFVIVRENTEGLYSGMGGVQFKGTPHEVATQVLVDTRMGVERAIRHGECAVLPDQPRVQSGGPAVFNRQAIDIQALHAFGKCAQDTAADTRADLDNSIAKAARAKIQHGRGKESLVDAAQEADLLQAGKIGFEAVGAISHCQAHPNAHPFATNSPGSMHCPPISLPWYGQATYFGRITGESSDGIPGFGNGARR